MNGRRSFERPPPERRLPAAAGRQERQGPRQRPDALHVLGKIHDALAAGDEVIISPGSVRAAEIAAAVQATEGGRS